MSRSFWLRPSVFALVLLAALAGARGCAVEACAADPTIKLPAEVRAKPGRLLRLQAETEGKHVRWFLSNPDDADLIPITAEKAAIFCSPVAGRYRVYCYTAAGDVPSEPAVCLIIVGDPPKPPPGPDPPEPKPPEPTDPFAKALQAAYTADPSATKANDRAFLWAVFRNASDTAQSPKVATAEDLLKVLHEATQMELGTRLHGVRRAIADELNKVLPTVRTAPLDPATRSLCAAQFQRVAKVLEGLR